MKAALLLVAFTVAGVLLGLGRTWYDLQGSPYVPTVAPIPLPPEDGPQPVVEVDNEDYDFGELEYGASGSHSFIFHNLGEYDLRLKTGEVTCKCTVSNLTQDSIPPGGSAEVRLDWTVKTASDEFRQSALILTNDRNRPRVVLSIHGKVIRPVMAIPENFALGSVQPGEVKSAYVDVYTVRDEPLEGLEAKVLGKDAAEQFTLEVAPLPRDQYVKPNAKSAVRVTLTTKSTLPPGQIRQTIRLVHGLEDVGPLEVSVTGRVAGNLTIVGAGWDDEAQELALPDVNSEAGLQRRLNLFVRGSDPQTLKWEILSTSPEFVAAHLSETEAISGGRSTRTGLSIEIPAGQVPGNYRGDDGGPVGFVKLKSSDPTVGELLIPLKFAIVP